MATLAPSLGEWWTEPGMMYFPTKWGAIWNPRILKSSQGRRIPEYLPDLERLKFSCMLMLFRYIIYMSSVIFEFSWAQFEVTMLLSQLEGFCDDFVNSLKKTSVFWRMVGLYPLGYLVKVKMNKKDIKKALEKKDNCRKGWGGAPIRISILGYRFKLILWSAKNLQSTLTCSNSIWFGSQFDLK